MDIETWLPWINWAALAVLLPLALASVVGLPFWLRQKAIAGNLLGSGIIAAVIIVLIWREFGAVVQAQNECVINCAKSFEEIYSPLLGLVVMGWVDVLLLLILSGIVEDRAKRGRFRKDWL